MTVVWCSESIWKKSECIQNFLFNGYAWIIRENQQFQNEQRIWKWPTIILWRNYRIESPKTRFSSTQKIIKKTLKYHKRDEINTYGETRCLNHGDIRFKRLIRFKKPTYWYFRRSNSIWSGRNKNNFKVSLRGVYWRETRKKLNGWNKIDRRRIL